MNIHLAKVRFENIKKLMYGLRYDFSNPIYNDISHTRQEMRVQQQDISINSQFETSHAVGSEHSTPVHEILRLYEK